MTRYRVLPYRQGSKGAKALAAALGGKVLKLEGSNFVSQVGDIIINWGNTDVVTGPYIKYPAATMFNRCDLKKASNKLNFFNLMATENADIIPRYWTSQSAIPDDAFPIVCRTVLAGHSGDGIVLAQSRSDLVSAPLYVEYIKKEDEYRVHVGRVQSDSTTSIIAIQRKARRHDVPDSEVNWQVRNHKNGFVFTRNGFTAPSRVVDAAKQALVASGLDFGAVDVIYNKGKQRAYVLEINTAPGLEGQTIEDYATFFKGA